ITTEPAVVPSPPQNHQVPASHLTFPNVREMFESQRLVMPNGSTAGRCTGVQPVQGQFGTASTAYNGNSGAMY
ncbi:hypothetical protein AC249_AIPGENE28479, partial [Exaiptasia diaphana]